MNISLINLLESKNFEELTPEENAWVLTTVSESAYRQQRKLVRVAQEMAASEKANLKVNPATLLLARQKLKDKKKTGGAGIFVHRVPTWMAVAACLLIFLGLKSFYTSMRPEVTTRVVTETIHDTVYTVKIVTEKINLPGDTVTRYVYVHQPETNPEVIDNTNYFSAEEPSFEHLYFKEDPYCTIMSCYEPRKGISVANDTLLAIIPKGI